MSFVVHQREGRNCEHDEYGNPDQPTVGNPARPVLERVPVSAQRPKKREGHHERSSTCMMLTLTLPRPALRPSDRLILLFPLFFLIS